MNYNEATPDLRRIPVYLEDTSGNPVTGATPTGAQLQVCLSGAAWVNGAGVWVAQTAGSYYYEATQAETVTNSYIQLRVVWPGAKTVVFAVTIGNRIVLNEPVATKRRIPIYLETSAGVPVTGQADLNINISKNGTAFAGDHTGVEVGLGAYYYELTVPEVDTLGYGVLQSFPPATEWVPYVFTWDVITASGGSLIAPIITIVSPTEGDTISRNTALVFTVAADASVGALRRVVVTALLGGSVVDELIHGGVSFAAPYQGGGNSRVSITGGYQFNIPRLGGWRGSSISLRIVAVDIFGNLAQKTLALPEAIYTWQVIDSRGNVTPFVGEQGR